MNTTGASDRTSVDPTTAEVLRAALHDLKGPSGRLRVLAELINRSAGITEDTRTLLQHIVQSASSLDTAIEGLRMYSDVCMHSPEKQPVDLANPLLAAIANRDREIRSAGAQVVFGSLPRLCIDPAQITWLFQELIANTLRFHGGRGARMELAASPREEREWMISFSDDGPGIEAPMVERVFLPYKRGSRDGGAGMGLTICRKIIEMHGGRMWAEPQPGGASIRFLLYE